MSQYNDITPIAAITEFSARTRNALIKPSHGLPAIRTLGELKRQADFELLKRSNLGMVSLGEIRSIVPSPDTVPPDENGIVLHASLNELVFQGSLAALTGLCSAMQVVRGPDGGAGFGESEFLDATDMAHTLGSRLVLRHIAWSTEDNQARQGMMDSLRQANGDTVEHSARAIASLGHKTE